MEFGVVNKSNPVNWFVLLTSRNITYSAIITRKTIIKLGILKGGKLEKSHKVRFFPATITKAYRKEQPYSIKARVELTLKISDKKVKKKTGILIDALSMFIAIIVIFIDKLSLIWLIDQKWAKI